MSYVLPIAVREGRRRVVLLAALFAAVALLVLALGAQAPKKYTSAATIRVQESNIIEPLLKGRAMATTVTDHASIAREIAFSRKTMDAILETGGWTRDNPTALQREQLREQIVARTTIANPHQNSSLIRISYSDTDPERAHLVTQRFADLVIQENLQAKKNESRTAFEFIDDQAREYAAKLAEAESALAAYYRAHPDAMPHSLESSSKRIADLERETDRARMEMIDQSAQAQALQSHLASERSIGMSGVRASQVGKRLSDLQSERDRLTMSYTDQHPDVVRVQNQINEMEAQLRQEMAAPSLGAAAMASLATPEFGSIRGRLAEARSRSSASAQRISVGQQIISAERERSSLLLAMEGEQAELTRNFETHRDIYRDLMERRENARLSMYMDAAHGDLSFRIQEPAAVPLQATGLRLLHVALAGMVLAVVVPLALLIAWVKLDPRVRTASQIESMAGLPVLGSIPMSAGNRQRARGNRQLAIATALALTVPLAYTLTMTFR